MATDSEGMRRCVVGADGKSDYHDMGKAEAERFEASRARRKDRPRPRNALRELDELKARVAALEGGEQREVSRATPEPAAVQNVQPVQLPPDLATREDLRDIANAVLHLTERVQAAERRVEEKPTAIDITAMHGALGLDLIAAQLQAHEAQLQAVSAEVDPAPSVAKYPLLSQILELSEGSTAEDWKAAIARFKGGGR